MKHFFLALFCGALWAQTELTVDATNCVHARGDNPAWAQPDYDDRDWASAYPRLGNPYAWSRCRLDLRPLALGGPFHVYVKAHGAWELYVDGQLAASFGDIRNGRIPINVFRQSVLAAPTERKAVTIALRRYSLSLGSELLDKRLQILAGASPAIDAAQARDEAVALAEAWPRLLLAMVSLVAGLLLLILFISDWKQRELLWFGLMAASLGAVRLLFIPGQAFEFLWAVAAWFSTTSIIWAVALPFFFSLVNKPVPRILAALVVARFGLYVYVLYLLLSVPQHSIAWLDGESIQSRLLPNISLILTLAPVVAFWPFSRIPSQLYLAAAASLFWTLGSMLNLLPQVGLITGPSLGSARNVQAWLSSIALLAMFVAVSLRIRRMSIDHAELQGELRAAQEVQRLLTSSLQETAPWAQVEVAYLPAKQVGGDFYYWRQTAEGQLIVVGDVSGKGLRAAMLASAALGALRHSAASAPREVLEGLNRALVGQTGGGFVTCCCILLSPSGTLTIANAGHPAPYAGGMELDIAPGIPLGLMPDVSIEQTRADLPTEASVTLLSDGVVEAENAQRELFGFDRTREISTKSAHEIAEAARAWGQNDDITVVTVRRATS